jgi:hypothetical protein
VAALLAQGADEIPDQEAAEQALVELVGAGVALREPLGHDAVWRLAEPVEPLAGRRVAAATT